jgi:4-amino-4-deoxy-L-arabinose transferase-like glycosyltransferase
MSAAILAHWAALRNRFRTIELDTRWHLTLLLYVLTLVAAWVSIALVVDVQPEGDNLEQLAWARQLAWGFDKHPPLPTMMLWVAERVLPPGVPLTYVMGGLQVAVMLWLAWAIAALTLDRRRAALALLFVSCITYYTNRMHYYNHNTALLVACALSVYCVWRAAQSASAAWSLVLGAAWGLGLLSKYQMVVAIACNLAFLSVSTTLRFPQRLKVSAIAVIGCAILITPHALWLIAHDFPSFHYAAKFVGAHMPWSQRPANIAGFLADQALRLLPVAVLLAILVRIAGRDRPSRELATVPLATSPAVTRLVAIHTWGPFILMSALSLLFGVDLETHWGTAFLWMTPLWFLSTSPGRALLRLSDATILTGVVALQATMLWAYR